MADAETKTQGGDASSAAAPNDVDVSVPSPSRAGPKRKYYLWNSVVGIGLLPPDVYQLRIWKTRRAIFTEFLATMLFVFAGTGAAVFSCNSADVYDTVTDSCLLTTGRWVGVSFAFGIAIAFLAFTFAPLSGANINPAVTLALTITKQLEPLTALAYVVAQLAGAIVGSAAVRGVNHDLFDRANGGVNGYSSDISDGGAVLIESFGTAFLVFTVMAAVDSDRGVNFKHLPVLGPFTIGLSVFIAHLVCVPITGCSINPARSFGPAVIHNVWDDHWVFWVGPAVGAIVAALVYELVLGTQKKGAQRKVRGTPFTSIAKLRAGVDEVAAQRVAAAERKRQRARLMNGAELGEDDEIHTLSELFVRLSERMDETNAGLVEEVHTLRARLNGMSANISPAEVAAV